MWEAGESKAGQSLRWKKSEMRAMYFYVGGCMTVSSSHRQHVEVALGERGNSEGPVVCGLVGEP